MNPDKPDKPKEVKEGDYVGELALLSSDSTRTATVRAVVPVTCLECNAKTFESTIKGSVDWKRKQRQRKAVGGKKKRKKRKKKIQQEEEQVKLLN